MRWGLPFSGDDMITETGIVLKGFLAENAYIAARNEHSIVMNEIAIDRAVKTELARLNKIAEDMAKINSFDFRYKW